MKIQQLKENEPLEVIEVSEHLRRPRSNDINDILEFEKIKMIIFTDGEIEKESEETSKNIEEYYFGKDKYRYDVDTLKSKNIYLKNHSYVITYLVADECLRNGWFDVIKNVSIYLKNPKDKKALKSVKQIIRQYNIGDVFPFSIVRFNFEDKHNNVFAFSIGRFNILEKFEEQQISKNVYTLRRINNMKKSK